MAKLAKVEEESVNWVTHDLGGVTEFFEQTLISSKGKRSKIIECSHFGVGVDVGHNIIVYGSVAHSPQSHHEGIPDFGLYADKCWEPAWRNEFIVWPDFELPSYEKLAMKQISEALGRAKQGLKVEVGCKGGHGRTGTILAIMSVILGDHPKKAINRIRKNYCPLAIETQVQENFVYSARSHFKD
jgi:hypothetical protein